MIRQRKHWIFDLDGTLTKPVHDFDAIRALLGVPASRGILEWLAGLPLAERAPLVHKLDRHELELAERAEAADGASVVLTALREIGCSLGIVTRNNTRNVEVTLRAAGLHAFFDPDSIMTRDNARPKPDPDGIHKLLGQWRGDATTGVMVGNHRHDLDAGRAAGVPTVHVATDGVFEWPDLADVRVRSLRELVG
jgi:phosphoglycolate phosphatase-like HAD superfamily hydrolase